MHYYQLITIYIAIVVSGTYNDTIFYLQCLSTLLSLTKVGSKHIDEDFTAVVVLSVLMADTNYDNEQFGRWRYFA